MALGSLFNTNLFNTRPLNMTFGGTKIPTCAVMFFGVLFGLRLYFVYCCEFMGFISFKYRQTNGKHLIIDNIIC